MMKEDRADRMPFTEILDTIALSDARTSTIIATSLLAEMLRGALKYNLIAINAQQEKELFENNGPLSSFAHRTSVAYAMGVISKKARDDLVILRRLRNDFAHRLTKQAIGEVRFKESVLSLNSASDLDKKDDPRNLLRSSVSNLCLFLILRTASSRISAGEGIDKTLSLLDYSDVLPPKLRG